MPIAISPSATRVLLQDPASVGRVYRPDPPRSTSRTCGEVSGGRMVLWGDVRYDLPRPMFKGPDGCKSTGRATDVAEFLAIHQTDASLLPCLLRRLMGRASLGPGETAAGVGYFQSDDVLVRKRPLGGDQLVPEKLAEGVE